MHPATAPDQIPPNLHYAFDYAQAAQQRLDPATFAYIQGGSFLDRAVSANYEALDRLKLVPRLAHQASASTAIQLLGETYPHPLMLAPVALQNLVHADAEQASARGAAACDTPMIVSTLASTPLEAIARHHRQLWFQLYLQPNPTETLNLLRRAEAAGYRALVVTVDTPVQMPSHHTQLSGFQLPPHCRPANLTATASTRGPRATQSVLQQFLPTLPTWETLQWLCQQTALPIWIKGVLHPEDALLARQIGAAGVVVSNHGGRAFDAAPAPLEQLPLIRQMVGPDYPLLYDGGIRSGLDVLRVLTQGANAVLIGRLALYALASAGALGVAHLLQLLRQELESCMLMTGLTHLAALPSPSGATHAN